MISWQDPTNTNPSMYAVEQHFSGRFTNVVDSGGECSFRCVTHFFELSNTVNVPKGPATMIVYGFSDEHNRCNVSFSFFLYDIYHQ
mgnify:CR=1 FL=1